MRASFTLPALLAIVLLSSTIVAEGASPQAGTSQEQGGVIRSNPPIDVTFSLGGFHYGLRQEYNLLTECSGPNRTDNCRRIDRPDRYNTWDDPFPGALQLGAGFYWKERWKTEVAVAWTDTGTQGLDGRHTGKRLDRFDAETIYTPSETRYVSLFHAYDVQRTSVSQLLQFRPGARVRPYVGVAIGIDRQTDSDVRHETVGPPRSEAERISLIQLGVSSGGAILTDTDVLPVSFPPPVTTVHLHTFGRVGVKMYAWKRAFFLVEAQIGPRVAPVTAGFGLDLF